MVCRRTALSLITALAAAALPACSTTALRDQTTLGEQAAAAIAELRAAERSGDPLTDGMADAYLAQAEAELAHGDLADAVHLAIKGRRAASGEAVATDDPSRRALSEDRIREFDNARRYLAHWIDGTNGPVDPDRLTWIGQCHAVLDCMIDAAEESTEIVTWTTCTAWRARAVEADCAGAFHPVTSEDDAGWWPMNVVFLFDRDSATLTAAGRVLLGDVLRAVHHQPGHRIRVTGHDDTMGTAEESLAISLRRAETVRDALIAGGVDPLNIVIEARGETDLAVPTGDGVYNQANRRVVAVPEPWW